MDEQGTNPDQLAGLQDTGHRVQQQRASKVSALVAHIDGKAAQEDDGYRLIRCEATCEPRGRVAGHDRTGRERVIPSDIQVGLCRDEYARRSAAMALESMLAQPRVERRDSALEVLGAMTRLERDGLVKAHRS